MEGSIKIGLADVEVDGLQAAKDVSCVLHKMTMSNQLRAVNSFRYPSFNQESNMYEIVVKGDKGSRFEEEKQIINSNDVMIKNSRTVKINFEDVIHDGQVEYAIGGHIVDTMYAEDTAKLIRMGSALSRIIGYITTGSIGLVVKRK